MSIMSNPKEKDVPQEGDEATEVRRSARLKGIAPEDHGDMNKRKKSQNRASGVLMDKISDEVQAGGEVVMNPEDLLVPEFSIAGVRSRGRSPSKTQSLAGSRSGSKNSKGENHRLRIIAEMRIEEMKTAEAEARVEEARAKAVKAEASRKFAEKQLELLNIADSESDELEEIPVESASISTEKVQDRTNSISKETGNNDLEKESQIHVKAILTTNSNLTEDTGKMNIENVISGFTDAIKMLCDKNANSSHKIISRQAMGKELPHFSGNPEDWPSFICEYRRTTKDCEYSDVENMLRLRKCLHGEAKQLVQSMMLIPENVEIVIKTLESYFGRPEYIIHVLIDKVQKTPSPRSDKLHSFIIYATAVRNLTSTIQALNENGHMTNPQLMSDVVEKLPTQQKIEWGRFSVSDKSKKMTLLDFSNWLNELSEIICTVNRPHFSNEPVFMKKLQNENFQVRKFQKDALFVVEENEEINEKKCEFCKMTNHVFKKCRKFANLEYDERFKYIMERRLCFCCLDPAHQASDCNNKKKCRVNGCFRKHHPFLHGFQPKKRETENENQEFQPVGVIQDIALSNRILLKILPVTLKGPKGEIDTFAFLDDGSTVTMLDDSIANKLGLEGELDPLRTGWINGVENVVKNSRRVSFHVRGTGNEYLELNNVRTSDCLDLRNQSINVSKLARKWNHLNRINLQSMQNAKPTLLIGQDNHELLKSIKVVSGEKNSPALSLTKLGWTLHGNCSSYFTARVDKEFSFHVQTMDDKWEELHNIIQNHFSVEAFGVKAPVTILKSDEDIRAEEILDKTSRRVPGRWETGLLWKKDEFAMPESKVTALQRLKVMERKMDKNSEFAMQYCAKIEEYLHKGYARKITNEEMKIPTEKCFYLPHFAVFNPKKNNKLRFVFDAAAKSHGKSFNDHLLKGPDLLTPLISVLFKFRQKQIGFTADIKEMFHQVVIKEEDQHFQRFLWRGLDRNREPDVYIMKSMIFGASSSPCSAQYIKNRNASEFMDQYPNAVESILHHHYVDDLLESCDEENEALKLANEIVQVHKQGGFEIRNFIFSSQSVAKSFPHELLADVGKAIQLGSENEIERVLGLFWNPSTDVFTFATKFSKIDPALLKKSRKPTKRECLQIIMSVYDPLGFLSHVMVKAKILMQELWRNKINWDEMITDSLNEKWNNWIDKLNNISQVSIPRCYFHNVRSHKSVQLHVFCDASEKAFAAVTYLRIETENGVEVAFVSSKVKVAPLTDLTIPRLELQAALLGSRLSQSIMENHNMKIDVCYYWTDSKTVICWLRSKFRRFKSFVANRISEIMELTNIANWNWVSTKDNVADEATRDTFEIDFHANCRWYKGPAFLLKNECEWPKEAFMNVQDEVNEDIMELKNCEIVCAVMVNESNVFLPDAQRFSSFVKLLRSTAWILRCNENCKASIGKAVRIHGELIPLEIFNAEIKWWKKVQWDSFPEEMVTLSKGKDVGKWSSIFRYSPYIDQDGVLRMNSRIAKAFQVEFDVRNPVILPQKHEFVRLLITHYHKLSGHHGIQRVMNEIMQKYVIPKLKVEVKNCWSLCQFCKNNNAMPKIPIMASLPKERFQAFVRPFTEVGMDYFGPLEVTVGRRREKRFGVIFSCLTTRAIHLEIAASLTTDSCIAAIRRFTCRRGHPRTIMSDNGTNLKGAERELRESIKILNESKIVENMTFLGIHWKFNPPAAPHMGGIWERLIRSVKIALRVILKERAPKEEVLQTAFAEAENIVNSRPLTEVSIDYEDDEALTPNHFLVGQSSGVLTPGIFDDKDLCLRRQWRIAQRLSDHFWQRWVKEYLPTLRIRHKWHGKAPPVKVGDIVIIVDSGMPRNCWPRGVIQAVFPAKDGQVRIVDVKTNLGVFRRPVAKLCVLDVNTDGIENHNP